MKARAKAKRGQPRTIQPSKRWEIAKVAAIILAGVLAYLPALRGGFVWDDEPLITANPLMRTPSGLAEIWSGSRTADYFPVTNTVFWIEHHLFGDNATGYHAVNILLQAANALLLWRVLRRLQIPGAFLAGLIFAIHPINAESVAWISELKNVLSMFFFLISALLFFEIEDQRVLNRTVAYSASLVAFLLALLSKTQVVFLPVALLLCAWWRNSPSRFEAPGQRQSVAVSTRDRPDRAILFDSHRLGLDHDLVSKSRHWRRRNYSWPVHKAFNQCRNGNLVVCQTSLRADSVDGGLPAMAIRSAGARGLVAFDCTHRRAAAALAATLWRPSLCLRLLHHRAAAGDRICAHVIRTQRGAGGGSSAVLRRHFLDRAV